ncbi:MAG: disulfide bond formation protein B [Ilumatobacteraceae bacterium]
MTTATWSTFFAVLALLSVAASAGIIVVCLAARSAPAGSTVAQLRSDIASMGLWAGWLVAATTTAGSLYYSLGAGFVPCELCWYQRIGVYPLTIVLFVAAWRRDAQVWRYVVPVSVVGAVIAAYHAQLQAFPKQTTFCSLNNPCTTRYVWEFGFVSMPLMSLAAFCAIITLTLATATSRNNDERESELPT